ncbi:CSC1-like protein 2 isoform X2 [Branchiostoma floridae]|uniref:CSC1-like protein 2 isoform X1 n=2 Tax=Branchiostoma floridae TaxID=7739 RepID=A0A9J7HGE9_BRAFL|nr:CSC1-like protein 2 isoform X1 [Branchiostoma floridae]XP_035657991.1 CSC1-like protein 2 isoform X2 [Branchiostoma floridae]
MAAWVLLLLLFAVLRKIAWDYGRLALMSRADERTRVLSSNGKGAGDYDVWTSLFYGDHEPPPEGKNLDEETSVGRESRESLSSHPVAPGVHDRGFCSWVPAIFKIKDDMIAYKCGLDAVQYMTFQRYVLVLVTIITVFSIAVLLPVNFSGTQEGGPDQFGRTTVSNLQSNNPLLWLHTVFSILYLLAIVLFMRHFTTNLQYREEEHVTRTLFIRNMPIGLTDRELIKKHFMEAYPDSVVTDVQFTYNITKLMKLDKKRLAAQQAKIQTQRINERSEKPLTIKPVLCGKFCPARCGVVEVDALEYYTQEEERLTAECEKEKKRSFQEDLGMAFVTFNSDKVAARIVGDYRTFLKGPPAASSVSTQVQSMHWTVDFAPAPDDVNWENLSISGVSWWFRVLIINLILLVFLFFLTTPAIILNTLDQWNYKKLFDGLHSPLISQTLPTLLLWTFTAVLPVLVYRTSLLEGHWTKSGFNHSVMRKTFVFLLFMTLILPSLGLTSLKAFVEFALTPEGQQTKWACIFLPDNGAFFVNYVITSGFIGTSLELIRFPELILYAWWLLLTRTEAEKHAVRQEIVYDFQFGTQYAWMMCIFTITTVYSITCPLIVPFGLTYMILKHLVDRYNIYYAYNPSRISPDIHNSAVNYVIAAAVLLQCSLLFFSIIRLGDDTQPRKLGTLDAHTIVTALVLVMTLALIIAKTCFGVFSGLTAHKYHQFTDTDDEAGSTGSSPTAFFNPPFDIGDLPFVSALLMDPASVSPTTPPKSAPPMKDGNHKTYGATEPPEKEELDLRLADGS